MFSWAVFHQAYVLVRFDEYGEYHEPFPELAKQMSNPANKRDLVLGLLNDDEPGDYIPAGFFTHFDEECHFGQPAIDKHLEFYNYTGMDFVKIQYEAAFPDHPEITEPADWSKLPVHGLDFYAEQLKVVEGLVKAAGKEALVMQTLYSPFMLAGKIVEQNLLIEQFKTAPEQARIGMQAVTESLLDFVRECVRLGVDGFYASTQGGEAARLGNSKTFAECIKPYDLAIMNEIDELCDFNILHICDFYESYDDLSHFVDYPGHVVNCNLEVGSKMLTPSEVSKMFDRPFMGGMNRLGATLNGSEEQVRAEVQAQLNNASERFILGASCTIPAGDNWKNISAAIQTAHEFA